MATVKKDWADKLVAQKLPSLVFPVNIANLLRQERRRAVRVCRKMKRQCNEGFKGLPPLAYLDACDDCARAIQGGK